MLGARQTDTRQKRRIFRNRKRLSFPLFVSRERKWKKLHQQSVGRLACLFPSCFGQRSGWMTSPLQHTIYTALFQKYNDRSKFQKKHTRTVRTALSCCNPFTRRFPPAFLLVHTMCSSPLKVEKKTPHPGFKPVSFSCSRLRGHPLYYRAGDVVTNGSNHPPPAPPPPPGTCLTLRFIECVPSRNMNTTDHKAPSDFTDSLNHALYNNSVFHSSKDKKQKEDWDTTSTGTRNRTRIFSWGT